MGISKRTQRRTVAVAASLATGVALAASAMAAGNPSGSYQDDPDNMQRQWSISDNLDNLFRVAGPDRISTSIKLMDSSSKWKYCGWHHHPEKLTSLQTAELNRQWPSHERNCDTVIVARADAFPDALASGPLADVYNAPILLTNAGGIDGRVLSAIDDHGFKNAILVGGTAVFPPSAMQALEGVVGVGDVQQVGGINRYETAVEIAKRVGWKASGAGINPYSVNVYLATGLNFPDALAAGAAAADNDGVVLLTNDKKLGGEDNQPEHFTYDFLANQNGWNSIFGKAVFNSVEIHTVGGQAEAAAKDGNIENVVETNTGDDRYATAVMLASRYHHPIEKIAVVSGETFGDAISAGGWVANHDGALLLTNNANLNPKTKAFLAGVADTDVDVVVVGGPGAVSKHVSDQLADELYTW